MRCVTAFLPHLKEKRLMTLITSLLAGLGNLTNLAGLLG